MSWAYEGVECYVRTTPESDVVPLYRAWNGSDHFYTSNEAEYNGLPNKFTKEGIACYVAIRQDPGLTPLFRLYKSSIDDHFYCISPDERDMAVSSQQYQYEGIIGYVTPTQNGTFTELYRPLHPSSGDSQHITTALYRAWNPKIGDHLYTTSVAEIDNNGPSLSTDAFKSLLEDKLGDYLQRENLYFADAAYFCPTQKVAQSIIDASQVNQRQYIAEVNDCDDFAHLLKSAFILDAYGSGRRSMPYALGPIWGRNPHHAMDALVIGDGNDFFVKIVEPQLATIFEISDKRLDEIFLGVF